METPKNCIPVKVVVEKAMRFKHYKPSSQQAKRGIVGRWQEFNGYGWDNCEAPTNWEYFEQPNGNKDFLNSY